MKEMYHRGGGSRRFGWTAPGCGLFRIADGDELTSPDSTLHLACAPERTGADPILQMLANAPAAWAAEHDRSLLRRTLMKALAQLQTD
jgi:hypothetical protein